MIRKGLQIGHNDCPNAGLNKLRAYMKENFGFILATNCSLDDIREVLANNRRWQRVRTGHVSNVDLELPSGQSGTDPTQTSCFQLLSVGTKIVGPGASEIVLELATVALVNGAWVFIFCHNSGGGHIPSCFRHRCVHVEPHKWCCLGQPSNFQRGCSRLGRTDRGPLVSQRRSHESWRLLTGARWSESRRAAWRWPFLLDKMTESTCLHLDQVCPWIRQPI